MSTTLIAIGAGIAVLTGIGEVSVLVSQHQKQWMQSQDSRKQRARSVNHSYLDVP